jgi:hypothetical protein
VTVEEKKSPPFQNILLDPFPYTDAHRVVAIQIHDTSSSRPGGRTFYQTPEFLDFQEQNHVFEEVIGGTGQDVLYNNGDGMEQFNGGYVTPNTFRFLGVPALLGRTLSPDDAKPEAAPVFVMSHKIWTTRFNQDPSILGKSFTLNGAPTTLVGVMPARFTKLGADLWFSYAEPRFSLILLGVFADVGLVLVALGVFSVIAYTVSRQTHEIGIRMALGANRAAVVWMVLRMGLRLVALGVAVGLLASFAVTRVIANQLWGVSLRDPLTLALAVGVVALAGIAACYFPARRATLVDPLIALRYE